MTAGASDLSGARELFTGRRYEQITLRTGGYSSLTLIFDPEEAEFTEWDESYLKMSLELLFRSARDRSVEHLEGQ